MLKEGSLAMASGFGELGPSGSGARWEGGVVTKHGLQTCCEPVRNYPFLPLACSPAAAPTWKASALLSHEAFFRA